MNKYFYVDHVKDIWAISKQNEVDVGVAYDQFRTDVRFGKMHEYNSNMDSIDFAALKVEHDELEAAEMLDTARKIYHDFVRDCYFALCDHWVAGDLDGMDKIVAEFKDEYEKKLKAEEEKEKAE